MEPKVIVFLINFNQPEFTIKCVNSILESNYTNYQIILIDNGSEYKNYEILLKNIPPRVILLRNEKNLGYVGGINSAFSSSTELNAEYFLIMNNDTIIDKEAIIELVNCSIRNSNNAIVTGKVYNYDNPMTLQYIGQYSIGKKIKFLPYVKNSNEKDVGQYDKEMELGMADDIFWLIPIKIYKDIGNYSNYFFLYGEQNDYALRVKNKGYKLIYTPKAKLWHKHHLSTAVGKKGNKKVVYWQYYSKLVLAYLHLSTLEFIYYIISQKLFLIIQFFTLVFKYNYKTIPKIKAFFYFFMWLFNKKENTGFNPYS